MTAPEPRHPLRVLLVEDSPRIAERVRDLLQMETGAEVVRVVGDEQSAVDAARTCSADVMILDLRLRHGTGFGVLKALGPNRPTTIIMTNYALPQYREKARSLGVEYFLDKSLDFGRLPDILTEIGASL
jgi:two-component system OmpR family response regulator